MLSRPGVRITAYSLGLVGWSLLITAGRSHVTSSLSIVAGVLAFLVPMLLFVATLKLSVPARYLSNPRFQRFDIALGFLCLTSITLVLASLVLTVLATDGQSPAPAAFVVLALIAAFSAGGINELSRRRFPDAWVRSGTTAPAAAVMEASQAATDGNLTIRPTRFTRGFIAVVFVALMMVAIVGTVQGGTPLGGIFLGVLSLAFTAYIFWISAGCDDERVWFGWRSVERSTLRSMELTSRPGIGVDYGGLRLLDSNAILALTVPSLLFADDDIQKLIQSLGLPRRPAGAEANPS
jgi:hypothetical protein